MLRAAALAIAAAAVLSAQPKYLTDHPGGWQGYPPAKPKAPGLSADDRAGAIAAMTSILEGLRTAKTLGHPVGFEVVPYLNAELVDEDRRSESKRPMWISELIQLSLASYVQEGGRTLFDERCSAGLIKIAVNDLVGTVGGSDLGNGNPGDVANWDSDEGQLLIEVPAPDGERHGFPVYGDWVMIAHDNLSPFAPASRELFLKTVIAVDDRMLARPAARRQATSDDPRLAAAYGLAVQGFAEVRKARDDTQRMLDGMSPDDRRRPAYIDGRPSTHAVPRLLDSGDDGAMAVMRYNPALLDAAGPRFRPRVIAVSIQPGTDQWPDMAGKLDQEIDWPALAKLLR